METKVLPAAQASALAHAADVIRHGGLVAFPTDTVYGLAAHAFQEESVNRLYAAKGRSSSKAIAILLGEPGQLSQVTGTLEANARKLAEAFWPGPLTLVVARGPRVPEALSPSLTVGVRIPGHPVALALLKLTGPLAVTSANRSDHENALTAADVLAQLDGRIHLVLDGGRAPGGVPSTVVDCTTPELKILRAGPITLEQLKRVI